jgi:phosphonatase-like hydrolase
MDELDLVIFDMAGTTVEDHGEVPFAFNTALADHHIHITPEGIKDVRGLSKRQAILQFIPPGLGQARIAEEVYTSFQSHLIRRFGEEGVHAIQGAEATFHMFRVRGVKIALNTGFDREITSFLVEALGWLAGMVDAVICGDDVQQGRPAPYLIFRAMEQTGASSVHRVANIGDTTNDLHAGYHAGVCWNIGVLSGAHDRQALENAPHTHILPSVAELLQLWKSA